MPSDATLVRYHDIDGEVMETRVVSTTTEPLFEVDLGEGTFVWLPRGEVDKLRSACAAFLAATARG